MKKCILLITAVILLFNITNTLSAQDAKSKVKKKAVEEINKDEELKKLLDDFNAAKKELEDAKKQIDEAKKQIQEAKKEIDSAKTQLKEAGVLAKAVKDGDIDKVLKSRLSPDKLLLGFFPNTDGFIDGKFDINMNYLGFLNSAFDVNFSTINDKVSEKDKFESTTLKKETLARAQLLGMQYPIQLGDTGFLGLKFAAGAMGSNSRVDTSGYKIEQGETIYFNTTKNIYNATPSADGEINMVLGQYFSMHLTGGYLAYVFIDEQGEKKYSSYENPVKYSFRNINKGYHVEGSMALTDFAIGDIEVFGRFYNYGGEYQTKQVLITGAYLTTIKTYSTYTKQVLDVGLNYTLTFLGGYSQYIPIISFGYISNYEKLGDSVVFDQGVFHLGVMVKMN